MINLTIKIRMPKSSWRKKVEMIAIFVAVFLAFGLNDPYTVIFGTPVWIKIFLVLSITFLTFQLFYCFI